MTKMRNNDLTEAMVYYLVTVNNRETHAIEIRKQIEKIQGFHVEQSSVTSTLRRGSINRASTPKPKNILFINTKGSYYKLLDPKSQDVIDCVNIINNQYIKNKKQITQVVKSAPITAIANNSPVVPVSNKIAPVNINSNLSSILRNIYQLDKEQLEFISNLTDEILKSLKGN